MSTQALTIRIGADASGAIAVISQTTTSINNLGNASNNTNASLQNLVGGMSGLNSSTLKIVNSSQSAATHLASIDRAANMSAQAISAMASSMSRLEQQLSRTSNEARNTANSFGGLNSVLGAFGITVGAIGLAELTKSIVRNGMEIESLRAQLNMTMPSLAAAKQSFDLIVKIAKETPQSISEISKAFIMMNNMGLNPTEKAMRGLTDMAAKLGGASDTLTGVIRGLGQAWMKGALHAQDVNQMIERGVPVYALLVKVTGKTTAELIKMMEAGELTRDVMTKLHEELYKWGEGSSAKAMGTLRGKIEALGSAWTAFSDVLMNSGAGKLLKAEVDGMTITLEYFTKKLNTTTDEQIAQKQVRLAELKKGFDDDKFTYLKPNTTTSRIEEFKQTEIFLAQLAHQKQKAIDDTAQYQKDKNTQAQGEKLAEEFATNKAIANGDSDALKKFMSEKLGAINEVTRAHVAAEAERAGISAKAALAIMAVESTGKVGALNKDSGAAGLMQVMPANYKAQGYTENQMLTDEAISIRAGLKVYTDSINEAKATAAKGAIEISQIPEYALALYSTKHQAIKDRMKKNSGLFDMNLMPAATQDENNKFNAALSLLNTKESEVFASIKHSASAASKATKEATTEAENAAKKIADNDRQLTESTAFGKYNATIDDLTVAFKRNGISQATYSQGIENANEALFKNTDYVQENIKLLDQQAKEYAKVVSHVGNYNATIDESQSNLSRKAITPQEHGLNVAKANAVLMNQTPESWKIPSIPVEKAGEVIDNKNINDSAKELAKFKDEMDKATAAFDTFGNSGKMAFDGILGGISAVASAATSFGDEMSRLNARQEEAAKSYQAIMDNAKNTEADKAEATKRFAKEKESFDSKSFAAEISGARSIAGATAKLFSEKSAARKAFHGIEMALAVVEMAMAAKKMVVDVAAGAANMFKQGGFAGFAGVAGMLAVMGGLGFAMAAGGDKTTDLTTPETSTTGSVFGSDGDSNSFKSIVDTLNSIHANEYRELKGINASFKGLVEMTTTGTAMALRDRGAFAFSNNRMVAPSKNPGGSIGMQAAGVAASTAIGAVTGGGFAAAGLGAALGMSGTALAGGIGMAAGAGIGTGAVMVGGAIIGLAGGLIIAGLTYGLGKLLGIGKVKIEAIGGGIASAASTFMLDGMQKQFNVYDYSTIKTTVKGWFSDDVTYSDVINRLDKSLTKLFSGVLAKVSSTIIESATILGMDGEMNKNISLPKMKLALKAGDKNTEENQKKIEAYLNKTSDNIAESALGAFFAQYQKMGEGMLETTQRLASQAVVARVGFDKLGMTVKLSGMALVTFSDSLARAFGGLKEMQSGLEDFYNAFTADDKKLADSKNSIQNFLNSLQIPASKGVPTDIKTSADATAVMTYLENSHQKISEMAGAFAAMANEKPVYTAGIKGKAAGLNNPYIKSRGAYVNTHDLNYILQGTGKTISSLSKPLVEYAEKNSRYQESLHQFEKAFADPAFIEKLTALEMGITMPDTIKGAKQMAEIFKVFGDAAATNIVRFVELNKSIKAVTSEQNKATTAIANFKKSIQDWVLNKQISAIGTPESQLNIAKNNYDSQLATLKSSTTTDAEKSVAMSKITGAADAYISKIEQMYAHGDTGAGLISGIVNDMSVLPNMIGIEELQLNTLVSIDETLESIATRMGYSGDYTDTNAMNVFMTTGVDLEQSGENYAMKSFIPPLAANDSSVNAGESLTELKKSNESLTEMVVELRALVATTVAANQEITTKLDSISSASHTTANSAKLTVLK